MTRMIVAILMSLALLFTGTVTSAVADETEETEEMGDTRAGHVYLDAVCPANGATDRFYRVIWGDRQEISFAETRRRLPELRRVSRALGLAEARAARKLFNPPALWPSDVDSLVEKIAENYSSLSYWLLAMGSADTAVGWQRSWRRALKVRYPSAAVAEVRARLGLPANGRGC